MRYKGGRDGYVWTRRNEIGGCCALRLGRIIRVNRLCGYYLLADTRDGYVVGMRVLALLDLYAALKITSLRKANDFKAA